MESNSAKGRFSDGKTSKSIKAELFNLDANIEIVLESGEKHLYHKKELKVESRIDNLDRKVYLPDGSCFTSSDHNFINRHLCGNKIDINYQLETNLKFVSISAIGLIGFLMLSYFVLIPSFSGVLAQLTPAKWTKQIGDEAENFLLDNYFDKKSNTSKEKIEALAKKVASFQKYSPNQHLQLLVESSEKIGPNAFALPNGTIIVTDQIIALTEDMEELYAVILHEVGHIHHNHNMERIISNSILSLIVFVFIGPVDFATIPLVLMLGDYSRKAEIEADEFAAKILMNQKKDPLLLTKLLKRIEKTSPNKLGDIPEFLLSHPHTKSREENLIQWKEKFNSL